MNSFKKCKSQEMFFKKASMKNGPIK